jgi:hypothetical protein
VSWADSTVALRKGDFAGLQKHAGKAAADELAEASEEYRQYTMDSGKELAPQEMAVTGGQLFDGYAFLTVTGKDWMGDKVEGKVKMAWMATPGLRRGGPRTV